MLQYLGAEESATYRGVEQLVARRAHNPEVVGSSPASATIKIPVFTTNTGIFLTFWAVFERPIFAFWANFGPMGQKIAILGHRPGSPGGFFMPFFGAAHRQCIRMLSLCFLR